MLVSSIARFNALKKNSQIQQSTNSFNGVQNKHHNKNVFSINNLKSAIHKLNVFA